jgi:hypothetical protein
MRRTELQIAVELSGVASNADIGYAVQSHSIAT